MRRRPDGQMSLTWHPISWRDFDLSLSHVREGDAIRNPVCERDDDETRQLAQRVDDGLALRGLKIDNTACCVGFVERICDED